MYFFFFAFVFTLSEDLLLLEPFLKTIPPSRISLKLSDIYVQYIMIYRFTRNLTIDSSTCSLIYRRNLSCLGKDIDLVVQFSIGIIIEEGWIVSFTSERYFKMKMFCRSPSRTSC